MSRDLRALLASVDLEALADHLLGGHRGHGRGARWPSPVPDHPQTGKTPPMSIFTDRAGVQRWSCWATGTSGTAIDLVATALRLDVAASIDWLAARHGPLDAAPPRRNPLPPPRHDPSPALRRYVEACQRLLWSEAGLPARSWLTRRRLPRGLLEANQVGFDPGPGRLRRQRGLPYRGPGVVLPTFDQSGEVVYAQVRYLDPDGAGRKYDNPAGEHGSKPALSWPRGQVSSSGTIVVCEGTLDALTVAGVGLRAVALLAAGDARRNVDALAELPGPLVVAVDNDAAGGDARATLTAQLADAGRRDVAQLTVPSDLNELIQRAGGRVLVTAVRSATAQLVRRRGCGDRCHVTP